MLRADLREWIKTWFANDLVGPGTVMFLATSIANFFNYVLHIFMSRMLGPAEYSVFVSMLSLFMILAIPTSPLQMVFAKYVVNLQASARHVQVGTLLTRALRRMSSYSFVGLAVFLLSSGSIASFLNLPSALPIIVTGGMIFLALLLPVTLGVLQGRQQFTYLGACTALGALLRLVFAILLVYVGLGASGALGGSVLAQAAVLILSLILLRALLAQRSEEAVDTPGISGYFGSVLVSMLCFTMLTNADVVLVKHFFDPIEAGYYSAASLASKILLYLPSAVAIVMFPKSAERFALGQDSSAILRRALLVAGAVYALALPIYWLFPSPIVNILFGAGYTATESLIGLFSLAMAFYGLTNILLFYHLSVNNRRFIYLLGGFSLAQVILLLLFHRNLVQVIGVLVFIGFALLISSMYLFGGFSGVRKKRLGVLIQEGEQGSSITRS